MKICKICINLYKNRTRNNELIIISPVYPNLHIDYNVIHIYNNNNELERTILKFIEYEPIVIGIYKLPNDSNEINVMVEYHNEKRYYKLTHPKLNKKI